MTTNLRERATRTVEPQDETRTVEPVVEPKTTGPIGGVSIYTPPQDRPVSPTMRPGVSPVSTEVPAEARATGSIFAWIVGVIAVLVIVYFVLQLIF